MRRGNKFEQMDDLETAGVAEIHEGPSESEKKAKQHQRKGLPIDRSVAESKEEKIEVDEVRELEESERRDKERRGQAFIPAEELPDPDSLSIEEAILEKFDAEKGAEEDLAADEETGEEMRSQGKRDIPEEIKKIISKHSLPPDRWNRLTPEQRKRRQAAIQGEINEYYLKNPSSRQSKKKN